MMILRIILMGMMSLVAVGGQHVHASLASPYLINLSTPQIESRVFRISHRFLGDIGDKAAENSAGMDNGAFMRIGFDYGFRLGMSAGISRSSWTGNYEVKFKHKVFDKNDLSASYLIGANFQGGEKKFRESSGDSYNLQLMAQYQTNKIAPLASLLHSTSTNPDKKQSTTAIALGARYNAYLSHYLSIEAIKPLHGYIGDNDYPLTSVAWDWKTGLHMFQLVLTNSIQLNFNRYISTQSIKDGREFRLGFSITRMF